MNVRQLSTIVYPIPRLPVRRVNDHRQCHRLLDWVPYSLAIRVSRSLECGSHAHDPACVMPLIRLDARMLGVLVTITESVGSE